jgi:hypothetical protein
LIEHFLARFMPLAELTLEHDLLPFFPPLEPGGNYWDTSFLRAILQNLADKKTAQKFLDQLVLTAYAWTHHHPLNWGAGGFNQWPQSSPYLLPPGQEDHRGFRIFDWYREICEDALGRSCPIFLLQAGVAGDPNIPSIDLNLDRHTDTNLAIARSMMGERITAPEDPKTLLRAIDETVVSCNFWLLAADQNSPHACDAWFQLDGSQKPVVQKLQEYFASRSPTVIEMPDQETTPAEPPSPSEIKTAPLPWLESAPQPISHYLLLPPMEPEKVNAFLNDIYPFIHQFHPTIGFSLKEAVSASHVSLIDLPEIYPEQTLAKLAAAGCQVQHLAWNGTVFAT